MKSKKTVGKGSRYVFRALAWLKPYWPLMFGAYFVVMLHNGIDIWMPMVIRKIVDSGIRGGNTQSILNGVGLLIALALIRGLFTFFTGRWTESASQNVAFDIRNRFHQKLQSLSFSFHDESEAGQLLARSVQDVDRIRFLTGRAVLTMVQMIVLIIGISVAMIALNPKLGFFTLLMVPVLGIIAFKFSRQFRPLSMQIRQKEAILTSKIEQNLRGSRIVKAFAREDFEIADFTSLNGTLLKAQFIEARLRSVFIPLMQFIAQVGTLVVLYYGGRLVMSGSLTIGELVAFTTYLAQLMFPVRRLGWILTAIAQASASAERIFEILDRKSEVEESSDAAELKGIKGTIQFENVSFSYARSNKVLQDVSFTIEPGEKVALLGGTGSGKSSIINLIPRFYDPTSGRIFLDGINIRDVTIKSLRDHIGMVLQDTILFAASAKENIAFGRPDASFEEIEEAAIAAHAHDFILSFPNGYDSYIGEQGSTLSGGQKQRVCIARAILKDPEILILDDSTSSVDTETEQEIQDALDKLMVGRTSIIIAQRLSTIRQANKVYVLDQGQIVAQGVKTETESPHDQLIRTSSVYSDIFVRQLRPENLDEIAGPSSGNREGSHD